MERHSMVMGLVDLTLRWQYTWVWVNSRSWWWTGRPGMLQFMGLQRVGHDWATELNCHNAQLQEIVWYVSSKSRWWGTVATMNPSSWCSYHCLTPSSQCWQDLCLLLANRIQQRWQNVWFMDTWLLIISNQDPNACLAKTDAPLCWLRKRKLPSSELPYGEGAEDHLLADNLQ